MYAATVIPSTTCRTREGFKTGAMTGCAIFISEPVMISSNSSTWGGLFGN